MWINEVGEFGIISKVANLITRKGEVSDSNILISVGDDCSVVKVGEKVLLLSTDMSIEDVHFFEKKFPSPAIGWKAIVSAWSDIASMGGIPRWALVSWGLPYNISLGKALSIYEGMVDATKLVGGVILGGDTVCSEKVIIDVAVVGECSGGKYVTRRDAKVGDIVAITGTLGHSLAGLLALEKDLPEPYFWRAHWYPLPRVKEGIWLCENGFANAMIDISDGLLGDAKHIAEASNVGINIETEKLPISARLRKFCETYNYDPVSIFLKSGEEYELLLTISPEMWDEAWRKFNENFKCGLTEIGKVTDGWVGVKVDGEEPSFEGYEHFKT